MDDIFARKTGDVRAGTADIFSLDNNCPLAFLRLSPGNVFACLAATSTTTSYCSGVGMKLVRSFVARCHYFREGYFVYDFMNSNRYRLISSLCVVHIP
jgi:hypothetical protein